MKATPLFRWLLVSLLTVLALGCDGDQAPPKLDLLPAEDRSLDEEAEAERLRKMQLITIIQSGVQTEISMDAFYQYLVGSCGETSVCHEVRNANGTEAIPGCLSACTSVRNMCRAKTLLALTRPQGAMVTLNQGIKVPEQSETAKQTFALLGLSNVTSVANEYLDILRAAGGIDTSATECTDGTKLFRGTTLGVYAGTGLQQAFEVYGDLIDAYIQVSLNSADAELNSSTSVIRATRRALTQRLAATRELGGESSTLPSDLFPTGAFCSRTSLTPAVRAAISVIRDAAPAPADLLAAESVISTQDLIEGIGSAVPQGSVRQRLGNFYWGSLDPGMGALPVLPSGKTVEEQYDLDLNTFKEARAYLKEEFVAFARTKTAKLKKRTKPDGTLAFYDSYAGTATTPSQLPSAYYGALVRVVNGLDSSLGELNNPVGGDIYNQTLPGFISAAHEILEASQNSSNTLSDAALGPVGMIIASGQYQGFVYTYQKINDIDPEQPPESRGIAVYGFSKDDGIKLAIGEDDLRCAVQGSIEGGAQTAGASCSLSGLVGFTDQPFFEPFASYQKSAGTAIAIDKTRVYLLKPRGDAELDPMSPQALLGPGSYEPVIGFNAFKDPLHPDRESGFAIVRGNEDRIAALLEPSKDWCARPRVDCAGGSFDERIALEDELTDDNNGIESSWRHYLELAKSAAFEADQLGVDYINQSLSQDQNFVDNERAKEQQLQQANAELEKLQQLCGFSIDTQSLLTLLTDGDGNIIKATTNEECSLSNACDEPGYVCKGARVGHPGTCMLDISAFLNGHKNDPDIQRIADCIEGLDPVPFISLGDVPLCLWRNKQNHNLVCKLANGSDAPRGSCPQILDTEGLNIDDLGADDATTEAKIRAQCRQQLTDKPSAAELLWSKPLNYFNVSREATSTDSDDVYDIIRDIDVETWEDMKHDVVGGNYLDPSALVEAISHLDWESRWDGYAAIKFLGADMYTTGDGTQGPAPHETDDDPPEPASWPCGTADKPWRRDPNDDDRPASYDCTDADGLAAAGEEMFKAIAAAKLLGPLNDTQLFDRDSGGAPFINFGLVEHDQLKQIDREEGFCVFFFFCSDDYEFPQYNCGTYYPRGTESTQTCDSSRTLLRPDNSPIMQSSCSTGTAYTSAAAGVNELDDRFGNLGCFHHSRLHASDHATTDTALKGLSESYPGSGWLTRYLKGKADLTDKIGAYTWAADSTRIPGATGSSGSHRLDLTGTDLLMGLGLIARGMSRNAPVVTLDHPPIVRNIDDLEGVSVYVDKVADHIRNGVSSLAFANVPLQVADALRSESASGSYPQFGGDMQAQLSAARGALLRIQGNAPLLANEVTQIGVDIRALKSLLRKSKIRQDISSLELAAQINNHMTNCYLSFTRVSLDFVADAAMGVSAAMTCANAITQIGFASDIAALTAQDAELEGELAVADFAGKFSSHSTALQTLGSQLLGGAEDLDMALGAIENNRNQARSALMSALAAGSFQAEHQATVENVLANLSTAKQVRYSKALTNAKRLSFVAKRAIEQRLALRLADVVETYPLVEAPATWESTNCSATGLDYSALTKDITDNPDAPQSFANGFIGDYVQKLENFVESYSLENNFHEGTDTAVISLKSDIMNVRKPCYVETPNILFNAGQLDQAVAPGWSRESCPTHVVEGQEISVPDCVNLDRLDDAPLFVDRNAAQTSGYAMTFETASTTNSAITQSVSLPGGLFRFSWYTKETGAVSGSQIVPPWNGGANAGVILPTTARTIVEEGIVPAATPDVWNRRFIVFRLDAPTTIRVGFGKPSGSGDITVSAPMLEQLQDIAEDQALVPFVNTGLVRLELLPECDDTDGSVFRSTRWQKGCVKLCPDGFATNCAAAKAKDYCYWQTEFGFSQRDIQLGKVFNYSGFARGNFNYRIDSVGLNFVGTSLRDCSQSPSPQTCYAAGYLPMSLSHLGPLFVRNYKGDDVETKLFDGNIEHARGLATERYLTNPLSEADNALIQQYMRREFAGRPLDGNFVLRVWEEDGVDFTAIEDVQVVLNYRYWTKFD